MSCHRFKISLLSHRLVLVCNGCYSERKNYADARATCRSAPGGGDLVTVDSAEMQEFMKTQLGTNADMIWLGVKATKTEWRWVKSEYFDTGTMSCMYMCVCLCV